MVGLPDWLACPLVVEAGMKANDSTKVDTAKLDSRIIRRLKDSGISHWFPVQQALISMLLNDPEKVPGLSKSKGGLAQGILRSDLCVAAPTGSGKTLAYAIPIVQSLISRVVPRVRALILVPTRDLASQVRDTFIMLTKGTSLNVAVLTGQSSFATEKNLLVKRPGYMDSTSPHTTSDPASYEFISKVDIVIATPGRLLDHLNGTPGFNLSFLEYFVMDEADRLLSQSFQEWLPRVMQVIENRSSSQKDSVYAQAHEDWVYDSLDIPRMPLKMTPWVNRFDSVSQVLSPSSHVRKLLFSATLTNNPEKISTLNLVEPTFISVSGLSPSKTDTFVDAENAHHVHPDRLLRAMDGNKDTNGKTHAPTGPTFVVPETLTEQMVVVESAGDKPLFLLHALLVCEYTSMLVFVKSVEAAHRLTSVVNAAVDAYVSGTSTKYSDAGVVKNVVSQGHVHFGHNSDSDSDEEDTPQTHTKDTNGNYVPRVAAFSSDLSRSIRKKLLSDFAKGKISALICSDLMARGMDISSIDTTSSGNPTDIGGVQWVLNYDIPTHIQNYVHRIGRSARAGKKGTAISLLEFPQVKWFKSQTGNMTRSNPITRLSFKQWVSKKGHTTGEDMDMDERASKEIDPRLVECYQQSLKALADSVQSQKQRRGKSKAIENSQTSVTDEQPEEDDSSIATSSSSDTSDSDANTSDSDAMNEDSDGYMSD